MTEEETIAQWLVVAARDRDEHTLVMILDFMEVKGLWTSRTRIEIHFLRAFLRRVADVGRPETAGNDWHIVGAAVGRLKLAMIPAKSGEVQSGEMPAANQHRPS
jgi:hypothetical protein